MAKLPARPKNKAELSRNPEAVGAIWDFAVGVSQMPGKLVRPSAAAAFAAGKPLIVGDGDSLTLLIPLQLLAYGKPTGVVSRAAFVADKSNAVSNPPTQAQVQAIQADLKECRQLLAAIILDMISTGQITPNG